MSCKICGRSSCAKWMHSIEEQIAWDEFSDKSNDELIHTIISLRNEVKDLQEELDKLTAD